MAVGLNVRRRAPRPVRAAAAAMGFALALVGAPEARAQSACGAPPPPFDNATDRHAWENEQSAACGPGYGVPGTPDFGVYDQDRDERHSDDRRRGRYDDDYDEDVYRRRGWDWRSDLDRDDRRRYGRPYDGYYGHHGHRRGRYEDDGDSSGEVAAALGILAGVALLGVALDSGDAGDDLGRGYGRDHRSGGGVAAAPGSGFYGMPHSRPMRLEPGYSWVASARFRSIATAVAEAEAQSAAGRPAQVFQAAGGDFVVVIGAAPDRRAEAELWRLEREGAVAGGRAFLTDGDGFVARVWAAEQVIDDERYAGLR